MLSYSPVLRSTRLIVWFDRRPDASQCHVWGRNSGLLVLVSCSFYRVSSALRLATREQV